MAKSIDEIRFILGENRNLQITVTHEDGIDLSSATATITIKDITGAVIVNNQNMTGTGTTSRIFTYFITTGAGDVITATGQYFITYDVLFNLEHVYFEQTLRILSSGTTQTAYSLDTDIGKVRFWIPDVGTVEGDPQELLDTRYTDAEIQHFIDLAGLYEDGTTRFYLAAAYALEQWANELAQTAAIEKISIFSEDTYKTYLAMADRAKRMREMDAASVDSEGVSGLIAITVTQDRFPRFNTDLQTTHPFDQW